MQCKKKCRRFRAYKDEFLCYRCWVKNIHIIGGFNDTQEALAKALDREYEINGYITKDGRIMGQRTFPACLIGRKVKVVVEK